MGWIEKMRSLVDLTRPAVREYRAALQLALADGELSDDELRGLNSLAERLQLDVGVRERLYVSALAAVFNSMSGDRRIDDAERASLIKLQAQLDVDLPVETMQEYRRYRLLAEIDQGQLPVIEVEGVVQQAGEELHWSEPGCLIEERVVSRQYQGGSSGVSIPIGGGVRWRVGAAKGRSVAETGMVAVAEGSFVITSKRMLFAGNKKSFAVPHTKLVSINLAKDGIVLGMATGKSREIAFKSGDNVDVIGGIISAAMGRVG